ncbi:MAG: ATP-binding cassette domain-containing protein, partial [Candidatus Hydrogenedentes bacterium]|nr:ATP-binding cassette domain-containing protein [Candidatus Hydrogenedentota bacterium]
ALFYFGFMRASWVESWAWRIVLAPTVFFAVAALQWMMIRAVTAVKHVSVFHEEDVHISITNLTKVFGADSRFARDWKIKRRREAGMRARGEPLVNKRHLREDLIWKIPLLGLLVYFHNYFDNLAWLFITACATWVSLYDLVQTIGKLVEGDAFLDIDLHESRWRRVLWRSAVRLPAFIWVCYFYWELRAQLWLAVLFFVVALLLHWLHDLAGQARRDGIDTSAPGGPLSRLKRAALRIPVVAGVRPQVHALSGVNLEIGKGVFGLLGPNGAGKTTLMRLLTNIYEPTYGCVKINGRNIRHLRADVQPIIGYLPQHFGLYGNFTVWDYLTYFALLNDIFDKDERETLVKRVIREVSLEDREHDRISSLSGGMKQRVGIAQTLLHLPKIIVVDEPTAGLDPMERIRFRNLLAELGKDRIVIFSTHITEDVMSACHDLAVLDKSSVVFRGAPEEMQRMAA